MIIQYQKLLPLILINYSLNFLIVSTVFSCLTNRLLNNLLLVFVIAHLIEDWHKEILKLH